MTEIGFIGVGTMGSGMIRNLVKGGHRPVIWNRTPGKATALSGVEVGSGAAEVAERCDIVFMCVSDTDDVEELAVTIFGAKHSGIVVDHSTISPSATARLAGQASSAGIEWVDAPVSGGSEGAINGTLAVMAGGPAGALSRARPYIDCYASSVVHVGDRPGSGQMAKLVNQILVVVNQLAVSESLLLADAAGLDLDTTISAVEGGAAGSWMLSNRGPQMARRDWRPGFTIDLQQKDLRLVLEAADELGVPTPGVALVFQLYRALQNRGLGAEGNHALVKALEEMAGRKMGSGAE